MTTAILLKLTAVLQTDTIVARGDVTVCYTYILGVVDINTVTIADLQIIEQVDTIDHRLVTTNQMNGPISALLDGHVTNREISDICQRQHMRTRVECLVCQWLQLITVFQFRPHESDSITMNGALARNTDVLSIVGIEPQHTFALILSEGTQVINTFIGMSFQRGGSFQIQLHITLQFQRTSHKDMITG